VRVSRQSWLTFRPALALGGNVRKGERGTTVVYADRCVPDDEKRRARETVEDAAAIPFRSGSPSATPPSAKTCLRTLRPSRRRRCRPERPRVEALIRATGVDFRIGGNRAFYAPGRTS